MNCLVTGGAGFIGTNLVEELVRKGNRVRVIDNLSVSDCNVGFLKGIGADLMVEDIANYEGIRGLFEAIDVVFHLAAMNRAQRSIEDPLAANSANITGTLNVLEASRRMGVKRFINISSSSVYAGVRDGLLSEDMPLAPPHPYGVGKLAGEHYVRIYHQLYNLSTVTLRYFSVYGPRQLGDIEKAGVIARFIHLASSGKPLEIYGDGEQQRNFTYISDVVQLTIKSSDQAKAVGEIINVANPKEVSVNYLSAVVEKVIGKPLEKRYLQKLSGDPERNPADVSKADKLLGFIPKIDFQEGIEKTVEWYKSCKP
ncbi:MAG: GDP-mannose 4,6-dehydratase [bacterium]|nr:GDP-mannose 4,6-dehydratase [bacterium]